jgi:hypothetical protein
MFTNYVWMIASEMLEWSLMKETWYLRVDVSMIMNEIL